MKIRFILLVLMLAAFHHVGAAEVCTPAQLAHVDSRDDHGMMCLATAHILTRLVRDSGWRCDAVVGSIMDPAKNQFFVTCRVLNLSQRADRAEEYHNYASVDGRAFEPLP